jgi:hypothetical protein
MTEKTKQRKIRYRHNKKRNSAFLFETLVKEMAKSVIEKDNKKQSIVAQIIKEHFKKGGTLYADLSLYRALNESKCEDKNHAVRLLHEVRRDREKISTKRLFVEQSSLIKKINSTLGIDVFANFVPDYKNLATIAQLFSDTSTAPERVLLEDKILEFMLKAEEPTSDKLEHVDNLVYKTFAKNFNSQYSGKLHEEQQQVLTRYVFSVSDNGVSLKAYLNEEIDRLRQRVSASLELSEIKSDSSMLEKTNSVLEFLDSLHTTPLNDKIVQKLLKVQELVRETDNG